jgi:glycogen(starch) synthase
MNQLRVLLTTDLVGGVWDFCLALAAGLDARVTLLALGPASNRRRVAAAEVGADIVFEPLRLEWMQDSAADVQRTMDVVASVARAVQADVVHANQFAAACANVSVPVVLTLHSDVLSWRRWTLGAEGVPAEWQAYAGLVRQALGLADHVVAVSQFLADEVRSLYSVGRGIDVIHNGWTAAEKAMSAKESITLVAGRAWDEAKNVNLAAAALRTWTPPGQVYLAGDVHHPETGMAMPVQPPLHALGHLGRADLDALLRRARVYLSPARYDPFGLLPLQAALAGCTLLLSDIPSYRKLWDGAACFFASDDAEDLATQWRWLFEHPIEADQLAQHATERAQRCYSAETLADQYQAVYARAAGSVAA